MPKTVDKLTAFKALLGDEAAKQAIAEAETREKAAKAAGVEFKEEDGTPVKLSTLLDQIDAAIASGAVVDDVNEQGSQTTEAEAESAGKQLGFTLAQFKEAMSEVVDAKIDAKLTALKDELAKPAKTEKDQKDEAEQAKQKEIDDLKAKQKEVSDKLAELMGEQPRNAGFRASRSETTVKEKSQVPAPPGRDELNTFIDQFVMGAPKNGNAP